ncbi:hypothetical protein FRZ67_17605 [Panacibacter ginsenosidivorans]|uniref:DUF4412 domain-containing protein n=1 Tax=Panacibacter ginsenosidivorans TaxID=1813871 RepID=A0A5B8VEI0_9BACT|nr:DUF6263 family protein [Panacibacter ginsenosidivorans]QEC69036.1 hypothetical protein FRZ67_17605 [Panacibacter ginsenosidivorans]
MLKKFLTVAAIAMSVIIAGCGSGSETKTADGYVLKFNMAKGTKFEYSITMDMSMKQNVMGKDMDVKNKMLMGYTFEVNGDSAGWKKVAATISRVAMDMNAAGMTVHFDTNEPDTATISEQNPMAMVGKVMGAMKGGQFGFTINENGEVGSVFGLQEMMQNMVSKANLPNAETMMQSISKSFDEENFKQNMQQSFNVYPGKPVKTGESWNKTMTMKNSGMDMKMENTYTLQSVTGDDALVKVVSKISSGGDTTGTMGMKMDMSGTLDGDMHYNLPTGMPEKGNMDMKMNMKMTGQGMEVPMDMDMKMLFEGKKL